MSRMTITAPFYDSSVTVWKGLFDIGFDLIILSRFEAFA